MILHTCDYDKLIIDTAKNMGLSSIFLAGPTPRDAYIPSWRLDAVEILESLKFNGIIFYPELGNIKPESAVAMYEWEEWALKQASRIVFWVPRKFPEFPAMTTNIEFGHYVTKSPKRCVYGRPPESVKNDYLDWLWFKQTGTMPFYSLEDTLKYAVSKLN